MKKIREKNNNYFLLLLPLFLLLISACATNPVTNRLEFMLVSEDREFGIGKEVDKQVREEMGVYIERPELRNLVKKIAESIGKKSHRPSLIYRAEIVDAPDFNAFAVPGGFVYVHRGLLERMNSTDELASVMGHEIAHVSARHSASQITKQQLMNIGVSVATIATGGELQKFGDLINIGSVLAFSKFSRDDEREADYLGIRYMIDAGYNPNGSVEAMKTIQGINEKEPDKLETWFMTHPPTSERIDTLTHEMNALSSQKPEILKRKIKRNEYIRLLDGMAVGEWNGKELIKEDRYYNKEFLLSIPIPPGWKAQINNKVYTAVFANIKNKSYAIFNIEALQRKTATSEYFNKITSALKRKGLKQEYNSKTSDKMSHGALSASFVSSQNRDLLYVGLAAFVKGDNAYSILEVSEKTPSKSNAVNSMINGLTFLPQSTVSKIKPPRMKIHEVKRGETWEIITGMYYRENDDFIKLAEYNGFKANEIPAPGVLIKIPPTLRFK